LARRGFAAESGGVFNAKSAKAQSWCHSMDG
jgi:hypothetical protein